MRRLSFTRGRMPRSLSLYLLLLVCMLAAGPLAAAGSEPGLLDLSVDTAKGSVTVAFESLPADFLYVPALQSGAGSNDLGLDRGQLGRTRWVRFERYGGRVLLIEPNLQYRADTGSAAERQAVEEAFAQSVLAGFPVENPEDPVTRIDLAPFLLSDATRLASHLAELEQGEFTLDADRSAIDAAGVRNFPKNTLIPVVLTFAGTKPGPYVSDVTPTPDSLSLKVLHQFIAMPDDGYQARAHHPRSGYFALHYRDYAAGLDESLDKRLIYRHRMQHGDTLRYYVDSGAPEPVRSALLEGASWWREAFAAAGFPNGFSVEVLPAGADPLDVRYNVIQWVHRSTRGWSYGASVSDPRTGEIIKGHVTLGSLRVRQDQLIAEALTAPFAEGGAGPGAAREMALARLRQLAAHEVGHTLGLDHNFAASFSGDPSVMDYPHPDLYLDASGKVALDRAYSQGVSPWDVLAIRYGYTPFPDASAETAGLRSILDEAESRGIAFISDQDARVPGSAQPQAHLWDNGRDVLGRLDELLAVRRVALQNFSTGVLPDGRPLFEMERRLVPVYLLHRYQVQATAKLLGGLQYDYRLKGEPDGVLKPVGADTQERALDALTALLSPDQLALPASLRYLIPPPPQDDGRNREFFSDATGAPFDHLAPARAGADLVIGELLEPHRLARLSEQHALNPDLPGSTDLLDALLNASWFAEQPRDDYLAAVATAVDWRVLRGLMKVAGSTEATDTVRGEAVATLTRLAERLDRRPFKGRAEAAAARNEISRFLARPTEQAEPEPELVPPGSPIG